MSRQDVGRLGVFAALGAVLALNVAQAWSTGAWNNFWTFALPGALLGLLFAVVTRRRV